MSGVVASRIERRKVVCFSHIQLCMGARFPVFVSVWLRLSALHMVPDMIVSMRGHLQFGRSKTSEYSCDRNWHVPTLFTRRCLLPIGFPIAPQKGHF